MTSISASNPPRRLFSSAAVSICSNRLVAIGLSLLTVLALTGCAGPDPTQYQSQKPALDLRQYFNGELTGWGMVQNRSGQVDRRFVVTIKASWKGDEGILDEQFDWSDGEKQLSLIHI